MSAAIEPLEAISAHRGRPVGDVRVDSLVPVRIEPPVEPPVGPSVEPSVEPMTPERAEVSLAADPSQIALARRFVRRTLAERPGEPLAPDVVGDLQLIVSELVSNTIEHGGIDEVVVAVEWDDRTVSALVTTDATAGELGPVESWSIAEVDQLSGRGLGIVRELADRVSLEEAGTARRVVATIVLSARS